MKRFFLSPGAHNDLDEIIAYIRGLPSKAALQLGSALQQSLYHVAENPEHGHVYAEYSALAGTEIRRFVAGNYLIFYAAQEVPIIFHAVLHAARDTESIMRKRLE